jgi:hypothetical protein
LSKAHPPGLLASEELLEATCRGDRDDRRSCVLWVFGWAVLCDLQPRFAGRIRAEVRPPLVVVRMRVIALSPPFRS